MVVMNNFCRSFQRIDLVVTIHLFPPFFCNPGNLNSGSLWGLKCKWTYQTFSGSICESTLSTSSLSTNTEVSERLRAEEVSLCGS